MNSGERDVVARQFGVSNEQVERDHLISHVLAFLSTSVGDQVQFIGGTALARTYLPSGRLSEDIDLIAIGDRKLVAAALDAGLPRALSRTHGRLTLEPTLGSVASTMAALLRTAGGLSVRIQLLSSRDRTVWPSERRVLVQRYVDAPAAELLVPTLPAFAASKTSTWADRRGARDLWDLWALSDLGAIDRKAADLYRRFGPTNRPPTPRLFASAPTDAEWQAQLAGQTRIAISARHALEAVREAWRTAVINDE
ncbi:MULTISPECIES: nucleotidyl transferase AbiEii/AbiGii toxin family protein [unclassified Mycobacterium]|uniref:nucleotidyl transferase AbiEii/AbiGii toxin family protein n=1 Tax=unclassified Mycobacterium TaxID=2642494 RepID=UPI0029C64C69|nr:MULTISPECIES: nucleotidyl transferase AbiEii/AbiGii toxin family protein [unclassified Mycobacterium]